MRKSHSSPNVDTNPHWSWHVLAALAALLLGIATLLYQLKPEPSHQQFGQAQRHVLAAISAMLGIGCLIPWSLRRVLSRDWRATLARQSRHPWPLPHDIIPGIALQLQMTVCLGLALWTGWVIWTLTVDDHLAARLTLENGLLQNLTVLCYAAAATLLFRLALPRSAPGIKRWWLLTLALGCLGVAGEEINWGQSIIEYGTPEFLARTNIQQEVSLHNLELPGLPGRHWSNDILWGIAILGGALMPLALLTSTQACRLAWRWDIPLPPWISMGYFLAAALIPRDGNMLGMLTRNNIPSELREVTIAFAMLIWAWSLWRRQPIIPADPADHTRQDGELDETRIQQV
ncbi:MAG TPA: hypothetical protein VFG71_00700 [Nitrospiraceae bacterium]|nr:hypothetical protein [Nitrospiraceae bacterium]